MRPLSAVILTAAGLSLAACGGSDPNSAGAQKAAASVTNSNKALQFAHCMRSHGVPNFPTPVGGHVNLQVQNTPAGTEVNGVQVNGPAFQSAMHTCRAYLPNGGTPSASQSARTHAAALNFARCMRSHGVSNFPDPSVSGGHVLMQLSPSSGIDPNSPAFKSAQQACQALIRKSLSGGG
jgi:hypothetical protein